MYWNSSTSRSDGIALLSRTQTLLQSEAATLEDADLATEATNVSKLKSNMRYASSS